MEACSKINKITMREMGVIGYVQCSKPAYKDGLCKKHYDKSIHKQLPWGKRKEYREATQEDLNSNRSLKLKNTNAHHLFKVRDGVVYQFDSKANKYNIKTDRPIQLDLYCVKL